MTDAEVLKVLRRAEHRLLTKPYDFYSWRECACGHIYAASVGHRALLAAQVKHSRSRRYREVVLATAAALGRDHRGNPSMAVIQVSSEAAFNASRQSALRVVRRAIAVIEARDVPELAPIADAHDAGLAA